MSSQPATAGSDILARYQRIPVWPFSVGLLWVLGIGYGLSFYDIGDISFALPVIQQYFHVSTAAVASVVSIGLVGYIVGALAVSAVSDLIGRRRALALCVILFTVGSLGCAFSPSVGWLAVSRFVTGAGIGSEIASITSYISEIAPREVRGRYTAWAVFFAFAGGFLTPPLALVLLPHLAQGWRILLGIGALGGLTLFWWVRIPESVRWLVQRGRLEEARQLLESAEARALKKWGRELPPPDYSLAAVEAERALSYAALLRPPYLGRVVLLVVLWAVYYVGNYAWVGFAPTLLVKAGFSIAGSITVLFIGQAGAVLAALLMPFLSDRFERKRTVLVILGVWIVALLILGFFPSPLMVVIAGFFIWATIGSFDPLAYTITGEHFPTRARNSGVALGDGLGHIGGALAPVLIFPAYGLLGFKGAFLVMALSGLVTAVLMTFTVPATRRELEAVAQ